VVAILGAAGCGVVGLALLAEIVLLRTGLPVTPRGRAWRTFGLATLTTALAVELLGTLTLVALSDRTGAALVWALLLGGLLLVPGLFVGALVGATLSVDAYRRDQFLA
jgi:hypothetical protein